MSLTVQRDAGAAAPPRPAAAAAELDEAGLQHLMGYAVAQANAASRAAFFRHLGTPLGLRPVEFSILMLLLRNPGATPKQLCRTLAVAAPSLTVLLDRMAAKGWLERLRSEVDRRAQNVHLTAAGRALAQQAHAVSLTMERDLLQPLTEGERALLRELLAKMAGPRG